MIDVIDVTELTCACGHDQRSHEGPTHRGDDPMCMGFHEAGHPFADPELVLTSREYGCSCEAFTLARPPEPEPFAIPEGYVFKGLGSCRSCGQAIAWALTRNDKNAPINRDGSSHFATCPSADAWRHRGRR